MIEVQQRPYVMRTGSSVYPLSSEEVENLIRSLIFDTEDREIRVLQNGSRLWFRDIEGHAVCVEPSTLGGGPAFTS